MPGQAIYAGPSLDPGMHSGLVSRLAVGIDGPFELRTVRSTLVPPRLPHQIVAGGTAMIFCYFDAGSARESGCRAQLLDDGDVRSHHRAEDRLATWPGPGWLDLAAPVEGVRADPRIAKATSAILAAPARSWSAVQLAREANLSTSRFLHLFRRETGTSFRRYRLWARMLMVGAALTERADLTTAAVQAGFASASHFSTTFHRMFGLRPSRLLEAGVSIHLGDHAPL